MVDGTSYRTELPIQERIAKKKDGTPTQFWARMPATMIVKCAKADCMRSAFPVLFAGAYDQAELAGSQNVALEGGLVIEGTTVDMVTGEIKPYPPELGQGDPEPPLETVDESEGDQEPVEKTGEEILDEAVGPSASVSTEAEWEALIEEIKAAGLTLAQVLPKGSETVEAFEAIGGTVAVARVRFGKLVE